MDIKFDKRIGEIYDIFASLWFINDFQHAKERLKKNGIQINKNIEVILKSFISDKKLDTKKLRRFFYNDITVSQVFWLVDMVKNNTIDEYLNFLKNLKDVEIRERIIISIGEEEFEKDEFEKISSSNKSVLNHIKDLEINSSCKWEIFLLLNDIQEYIEDFADFIRSYYKSYKDIEQERNNQIKEFNMSLQNDLDKSGIDFLNEITNNIFNFEDFENIYVSTTIFNGLIITPEEESSSCYVLIGNQIESFIKTNYGSNNLENNLNVFKNLSDKTRFSIIKLLLERDYFGLEIANALNITTATVSYHMNSLAFTGLIHIERKEHKSYYSLNKNTLRRCIEFLNNEFQL